MKMKSLVVKVHGMGAFPVDMLRYDNLTPYSELDSGKIVNETLEPRVVALQGWLHGGERYPSKVTDARWESFGWRVTEGSVDGRVVIGRNF